MMTQEAEIFESHFNNIQYFTTSLKTSAVVKNSNAGRRQLCSWPHFVSRMLGNFNRCWPDLAFVYGLISDRLAILIDAMNFVCVRKIASNCFQHRVESGIFYTFS